MSICSRYICFTSARSALSSSTYSTTCQTLKQREIPNFSLHQMKTLNHKMGNEKEGNELRPLLGPNRHTKKERTRINKEQKLENLQEDESFKHRYQENILMKTQTHDLDLKPMGTYWHSLYTKRLCRKFCVSFRLNCTARVKSSQ